METEQQPQGGSTAKQQHHHQQQQQQQEAGITQGTLQPITASLKLPQQK